MRQHPPSFGIVSRDCYDANLLAALRKAEARADAAEARVRELEEGLRNVRYELWNDGDGGPRYSGYLALIDAVFPSNGELT